MSDERCLKETPSAHYTSDGVRLRKVGAYFITLVTHRRTCLFGDVVDGTIVLSELGKHVEACWEAISAHFPNTQLDTFVVMPNHIHGIIVIAGARHASPLHNASLPRGPASRSLGAIVGSFKSAATKMTNNLRGTSGTPVWQRNYYEHIIRDQATLERIREYTINNPLQWAVDRENPSEQATHASPASPKDDPWRM